MSAAPVTPAEPAALPEPDTETAAEAVPEPDTDSVAEAVADPDTDSVAEAVAEPDTEPAEAATADEAPADPVDPPGTQDPPRAHQPATRRTLAAVVALAAAFVVAAGATGFLASAYLADRAEATTRMQIAQTATDAITTLWTYTPEDMADLPDRADAYLDEEFGTRYRTFIDAIAATNRQNQVTNSTEVVGAAVETLDGPNASAVVYTNTTNSSPQTRNIPALQYISYRLAMVRDGGDWRITRMDPITTLRITPQLG